nr:MAG: RNA-dependent RNA polymerase [Chemarfal virus 52]
MKQSSYPLQFALGGESAPPMYILAMSNPLRAPTTSLSGTAAHLSQILPDTFLEDWIRRNPDAGHSMDRFSAMQKSHADVSRIVSELRTLDMGAARTVEIAASQTVDVAMQQRAAAREKKGGPARALALAKSGPLQFRLRNAQAKGAACAFTQAMPDSVWNGAVTRQKVIDKVGDTLYVDAGSSACMGRLLEHYPKLGSRAPRQPVTRQEAQDALKACGVKSLPSYASEDQVEAYYRPLFSKQNDVFVLDGVAINPVSDNGYPVLGVWNDSEAQAKVLPLVAQVRAGIEQAYSEDDEFGVMQWVQRLQDTRPELVACRGKAKADLYTVGKALDRKLRFYNALPRQVMLNMMVVTQALEARAHSVLDDDYVRTAIGASLAHGGAEQVVMQLDRRLADDGVAWLHVGDDSWVVFALEDGKDTVIVCFSLDCTAFDLTQHSYTTLQVHAALRAELRRYDGPAADLWYAYMRERMVVTAGSVATTWKHAGPSGAPLQSKVNDMLMEVMVRRLVTRLLDAGVENLPVNLRRDMLDEHIQSVGAGLGFKVRLEDHWAHKAESLKEALKQEPFKFIGYYFYCEATRVQRVSLVPGEATLQHETVDRVHVYADVPRAIAQLLYPRTMWVQDSQSFRVAEAARLASVLLSLGRPPQTLRAAHYQLKSAVIKALTGAKELLPAGKERAAVDKYYQHTPFAHIEMGVDIKSLDGLLRAVQRPASAIWGYESPLQATTAWEPAEALVRLALPRTGPLMPAPPYAHPPTWGNAGRPPPTAKWGPPKPPQRMTLRVSGNPRTVRDYYRAVDQEWEMPLEDGASDAWDDVRDDEELETDEEMSVAEGGDYEEYQALMRPIETGDRESVDRPDDLDDQDWV